ncbi:MAG: hypothetical protein NTY53_09045, partial [Kiritimatiellaeota bacterium]|nr:hypothetical protein [Kiritimatiellota bacterium]
LAEARRSSRYTQTELQALDFEGPTPDAAVLSRHWHAVLQNAEQLCALLPAHEAGKCVLTGNGELCRFAPEALHDTATLALLQFHVGSIGGAWPQIIDRH